MTVLEVITIIFAVNCFAAILSILECYISEIMSPARKYHVVATWAKVVATYAGVVMICGILMPSYWALAWMTMCMIWSYVAYSATMSARRYEEIEFRTAADAAGWTDTEISRALFASSVQTNSAQTEQPGPATAAMLDASPAPALAYARIM